MGTRQLQKNKKMIKPIFLVGLPRTTSCEEVEEVQKNLKRKLDQYYSLVFLTNTSEIDFKCFFEKNFNEIKFEELKQLVRDAMSQSK